MRTSSILTRQISFGARRLWRAQTNPYAAQNPARARLAAHTDTPLSTLLTPLATTGRGFTLRALYPRLLLFPPLSVHLWRKEA